jgi:hypothetical protein
MKTLKNKRFIFQKLPEREPAPPTLPKAPPAEPVTPGKLEEDKQKAVDEGGKAKEAGDKELDASASAVELEEGITVGQKEKLTSQEISEWSKGYPEISIKGSAAIVKEITEAIKQDSGESELLHRDYGSLIWRDNHEYVLIYDIHHKPPTRLFKSRETFEAEPEEEVLKDPRADVNTLFSGFPSEIDDKNDPKYQEYIKKVPRKGRNHGDIRYYDKTDEYKVKTRYALLWDGRKGKGWRLFTGKPL